jgi:hypothetical protein
MTNAAPAAQLLGEEHRQGSPIGTKYALQSQRAQVEENQVL